MLVGWILLAVLLSADVHADTALLAKHLEPFRHYKTYEFSAKDYEPIQREYLAWVDSRVKAGLTVGRMNQELRTSNLSSDGGVDDRFDRSLAGFVAAVESVRLLNAAGLLELEIGIHTGGYCNLDQTVAIYDFRSRKRIARINAETTYSHGYHLRTLAVGPDHATTGRTIASEWVASSGAGNWNRNILRIDRSSPEHLLNVLVRDISVFGGDDLAMKIENDVVSLTYKSSIRDPDVIIRDGIAKYRVQSGRATRIAPIALSYGGFVDEWLDMNDAEAARWAPRQASAAHHKLSTTRESFTFLGAADCPGSPRTRAIAIQAGENPKSTVFLISGRNPEQMRMVSILSKIPAGCRRIDISHDGTSFLTDPSPTHH